MPNKLISSVTVDKRVEVLSQFSYSITAINNKLKNQNAFIYFNLSITE